MKNKIKQYVNLGLQYIQRLNDVRFAGQVVFVVVVLLISWSGVKSIQSNYGLQKQISTLNQQKSVQQLQNNNLKLSNQYYNSNQYLELSARENFGLASPGEKEVLVPQSVALAHTSDIANVTAKTPTTENLQPKSQKNFEAWADFFLHRQSTSN